MNQYMLEIVKDGEITKCICKGKSAEQVLDNIRFSVFGIREFPLLDVKDAVIAEWNLK